MTDATTSDALLAQIAREFPDVKWTSVRVAANGWDHFAVILDEALVFRVPKGEVDHGYFSEEVALLDLVARYTNVPVPKVTHVSRDETIMGHAYLRGDALDAGAVELLDEELLVSVADKLAQFLSGVHAIPLEQCTERRISERNPLDGVKWLRAGYQQHLRVRLSDEECMFIEQCIGEVEAGMSSCPTRVLLHGDLGLEHILLDRGEKQISIIDFSDWAFGDPAFDFCGLYDSPRLAAEVFERYRHREDCGDLLARAKVYNRRLPICMMIDSLQGYPCDFDESYRLLRRRFGLAERRS